MNSCKAPIDFVIMWVDGSDPEWIRKKSMYMLENGQDANVNRYRDWGTLRYWFRGVEKFAPWVNHVYLVTDQQKPQWLNTEYEKLTLVDHTDYIPREFLPTFSSHPIELNLFRIQNLSEQFVFFNDDQFLIRPVTEDFFFQNGLPCDDAILSPVIMDGEIMSGLVCANNMHLINKHFDKKEVIRKNRGKWLNLRYGKQLLRTICLLPWHHIPGFFNDHIPQPFLKSTFEEVWDLENEALREVCSHKFRDYGGDVNQWLMRYWQLCKGDFVPVSPGRGKSFNDVCDEALDMISHQKKPLICINDNAEMDFETSRAKLLAAFDSILPEKSSFELPE